MLTVLYVLAVVFSIGFLIFFHELGHFLAAKKVGIRVHAFSIGFGPRLFGFRRGETDYKVCLIPLGGYVGMAGEAPGEGSGDPRDFSSKTIGQRVLVVSAGVIANVILAFVFFPLAYSVGVPEKTAVIGDVVPGGPAWEAGLRRGDRFVRIDDRKVHGFSDVQMDVAFADEVLEAVVERNGSEVPLRIRPVYQEAAGLRTIGVSPALEPHPLIPEPGKLGIDVPANSKILRIDGRDATRLEEERLHLSSSWPAAKGTKLALEIETPGGERRTVEAPVEIEPAKDDAPWSIGVVFAQLRVEEVTPGTAAAAIGLANGDRIRTVDGAPVAHEIALRRAIADGTGAELALGVVDAGGTALTRRGAVSAADRADFLDVILLTGTPRIARVQPGSPAEAAGVAAGDELVRIVRTQAEGGADDTADLVSAVRDSVARLALGLVRNGAEVALEVTPARAGRNVTLENLRVYRERLDEVRAGFPESLVLGFRQTANQFVKIILSFRALLTGNVSARNMGGILTISYVSYTFVEQGLGKMFWFMAFLSLNLAFLNILPIPVLDGGHLMFLIFEKIKGRPLSERAMGLANLGGFVLIIGLMVFVTFNDVVRFFF
ncbi:MAG: RIP metalloprotease RseP [Planctomycetota bacterium]